MNSFMSALEYNFSVICMFSISVLKFILDIQVKQNKNEGDTFVLISKRKEKNNNNKNRFILSDFVWPKLLLIFLRKKKKER